MDYFDMILDMASGEGELDPTEARSVLSGAERQLEQLKEQVSERLPDGEDAPEGATTAGGSELAGIPDELRKPKEQHDRSSRADFYQAARDAGLDPNDAWDKLPE